MLHVVLWKWKQDGARHEYTSAHVNLFARMIRRYLPKTKHRIVLITDDPWGVDDCVDLIVPLWRDHDNLANATKRDLPSCYRRLKLYDPATQAVMGISAGDRILGIDLDTIVIGPLDEALAAADDAKMSFMGWALPGEHHPKVFNGSLQYFTAGMHADVWTDFDAKVSPRETFKMGYRGSDQSWITRKLVAREGCDGFGYPTIASFGLHVRKLGEIKKHTRIVFFHGFRKPWHPELQREAPWLAQQWR